MPVNDERFTGGDHFEQATFERAVHLAMMTNELNGGRGAYRISNAGLGASGPSYGPFQYDLGANARARELFAEIAGSALDVDGQRIISDEDLGLIRRDLYQPFSDIQSNPVVQATFERFLPAINSALASDAGHRLVNDDYAAGIEAKIDSMNAVIAAVPSATNRTFLEENRLAQLIVLGHSHARRGDKYILPSTSPSARRVHSSIQAWMLAMPQESHCTTVCSS